MLAAHHGAAPVHDATHRARRAAAPALPAALLHPDPLRGLRLRQARRAAHRARVRRCRSSMHAQLDARPALSAWASTTCSRSSRSSSSGCSSARCATSRRTRRATCGRSRCSSRRRIAKLEERAIQLINIQDYTQSILRSITSGVLTVGPGRLGRDREPRRRAHARHVGVRDGAQADRRRCSATTAGIAGDVAKVLAGRLPLALREATLVTRDGQEVHVQASTSRMRAVGRHACSARSSRSRTSPTSRR